MAAQASTLYSTNIRHMMTDLTPEKDGAINHDMEDDVIRGATIAHAKEVTFPPPPPKIAAIAAAPKKAAPKEPTAEEKRAAEVAAFKQQTKNQVTLLAIGGALLLAVGLVAPASFMQHFIVFVLAVFVGFPGDLGRGAFVAHTADGNHKRDLVDHHSRCADADRIWLLTGDFTRGTFGLYGRDQHIWRLSRDTAHARHVPEILRGRAQWTLDLQQRPMWSQPSSSFCRWAGSRARKAQKRAVWYGIVGRALAVAATLIGPGAGLWPASIILIGLGGAIGYQLATRVQMTQMPELVAAMHSLVGLAAVFVGLIAHIEMGRVAGMDEETRKGLDGFAAPLAKKDGVEIAILRVELFLGIFIGAVTFTGSVIAYGKLAGKVDTSAKKLPGGHVLNAGAAAFVAALPDLVFQHRRVFPTVPDDTGCPLYRLPPDYGHWRRGYAGRCVDAQQLLWLGRSSDWVQPR